ncbi:MAG TPA: MBL fold metallo-hydrolase [Proteobacteria bacterium]|nr:MBL fold metallo-hydrolase [Pseudomonadota bacterium]
MRIKYLGHACFLLEANDGTRILTDPYEPGSFDGAVKYRPVAETADIVLVSHDHADHNWSAGIPGSPQVIKEDGERAVSGIKVLGVPSFHDTSRGSERGNNIIFRVELDGLAVCHLGDLGHALDPASASALLPVDVLLMPVGGTFTIGAQVASEVMEILSPTLTIPMHFKTDGVDFPIDPVDGFLAKKDNVIRAGSSEITVSRGDIPSGIVLLDPSLLP